MPFGLRNAPATSQRLMNNQRLMRWASLLQPDTLGILHIKGGEKLLADDALAPVHVPGDNGGLRSKVKFGFWSLVSLVTPFFKNGGTGRTVYLPCCLGRQVNEADLGQIVFISWARSWLTPGSLSLSHLLQCWLHHHFGFVDLWLFTPPLSTILTHIHTFHT